MKDILKWVVYGCIFAVPFLTLYVENQYFFPFITGKNFWFRILVDIAAVGWVLLALFDVRYRPKKSWILWSFGALLVIMFFANLFGEHPRSSFWSNFERMDGYVSLVHTFLYMIVTASMLTTRGQWYWLLNTSLVAAVLVSVGGYAQFFDNQPILNMYNLSSGANRIDSTLGNAAYMAIYMLFHIFIAFWLFVESRKSYQKITFALLSLAFIFLLVETGTRGTAIGLAVGIGVMSAYIGLFGAKFKEYRKYAIGAFVLLAIVAAAFVGARDSEFVQENKNLRRIANISLDDLTVRSTIWGMGLQGVQERPILGYGQSNFNYVFNEYYDPSLYAQEQWFDRAHNIFIDWLVTGGIFGLIAYLGIFISCGYYLFIKPLREKDDETFSVLERGVLLGILAGYFTHNFVVFDNIISYIFFAMILGLIHSRVGVPFPKLQKLQVDTSIITQFVAPVLGAILIAVFYFWYLPGMGAASDIIDAFRAQDPAERLTHFQSAIDRNSFAHQEITEQIAQQTMGIMRNPQVSEETRTAFASYTEEQLQKLVAEKPNDARIHVFIGSYYRSIGDVENAAEQMAIARQLSPQKQAIIVQQGFVELGRNDNEKAHEFLKTAFELDESNLEAREYYAVASLNLGNIATATALMNSDAAKDRFSKSDFLLDAANRANATEFMIELFEKRTEDRPKNAQNWATLSFLYYQNDAPEKSIEVLQEAKEAAPDFAERADCLIGNLESGLAPETGCFDEQ